MRKTTNPAVKRDQAEAKSKRRTFVQRTFALGADQNFRWDKALEVAATIEDEELERKISLLNRVYADGLDATERAILKGIKAKVGRIVKDRW